MKYILDENREPVLIEDTYEWGRWFESADRVVAKTYLSFVNVSTVFMGLDYSFNEGGPPILFESMVFTNEKYPSKFWPDHEFPDDFDQVRYSTWAEAEAGHQELVRKWAKIESEANVALEQSVLEQK